MASARPKAAKAIRMALYEPHIQVLKRLMGESGLREADLIRQAILRAKIEVPAPIPEINKDAFRILTLMGNNLNQIARRMNQDPRAPITRDEFVKFDRAVSYLAALLMGFEEQKKLAMEVGITELVAFAEARRSGALSAPGQSSPSASTAGGDPA